MSTVRVERLGHVELITMDRPQRRHAVDREMALQLEAAWEGFARGNARAAVLCASGDQAFCAGLDLDDPPPDPWICLPGLAVETDKPVIAAVSGWAVGLGLALTMAADLAVAGRSARFLYPEGRLGMTGGLISGLASRVPYKRAMQVMLLGEPFTAEQACAMDLVNEVVDDGTHRERALQWAERIAGHAPLVTRTLKRLARASLADSAAEAAARMQREIRAVARSADRAEGAAAARERRDPDFRGH